MRGKRVLKKDRLNALLRLGEATYALNDCTRDFMKYIQPEQIVAWHYFYTIAMLQGKVTTYAFSLAYWLARKLGEDYENEVLYKLSMLGYRNWEIQDITSYTTYYIARKAFAEKLQMFTEAITTVFYELAKRPTEELGELQDLIAKFTECYFEIQSVLPILL